MNRGKPSPIPKVLVPLGGKPMISYIIKTLKHLNTRALKQKANSQKPTAVICKPILVVGYKGNLIQKEFGDACEYVWQRKRLGTGHAAKLAISHLQLAISYELKANSQQPIAKSDLVLILQGDDSAFYKPKTLLKFIENHIKNKAVLSFLTTRIFGVKDLGRIVRNERHEVIAVVEKENLTLEQEKIDEINCGGYLANYDWLSKNIKYIKKHLKKGKEYPLPDVIKIALEQKKKVIAYSIPSFEWIGINSPDQLAKAERSLKCIKIR